MQTVRNHITLIGNMGGDAQITNFDNGGKVARFSIATNKYAGKKNEAEWHRVFAWGNLAKFIESYGEKGKQLAIHGRLVNRTYLSKTGKMRKVTEVEVKHVIGL
ncbi:MAG TPA: single-stranded DNA-binding protein [Crocinitomicaceae bacterium]|nr:single-stranded DNA-binding protein [Crocinitomicaceae bacterium]